MNELNKDERLIDTICDRLSIHGSDKEKYMDIFREGQEYFDSRGEKETLMAAQLLKESPEHGLLTTLHTYLSLLLYGTLLQMSQETSENYYAFLISRIAAFAGVSYKRGYEDALSMDSPEPFADFVSNLELDDPS